MAEKRINELDFLFLDENINSDNLGTKEMYNRFLMGGNPFEQLGLMYEDFEGYTPIGVCKDPAYMKDYGCKYYPVVLENDKGERLWVHIPYDNWKEYLSLV